MRDMSAGSRQLRAPGQRALPDARPSRHRVSLRPQDGFSELCVPAVSWHDGPQQGPSARHTLSPCVPRRPPPFSSPVFQTARVGTRDREPASPLLPRHFLCSSLTCSVQCVRITDCPPWLRPGGRSTHRLSLWRYQGCPGGISLPPRYHSAQRACECGLYLHPIYHIYIFSNNNMCRQDCC